MSKSSPNTQAILVAGVAAVILILAGGNQEVQSSLSKALGLDKSGPSQVLNTKDGRKIEEAKVERVVDGDTIILDDGRTIRYLMVDTPETKKPNTPVQCFGPEASSLNKKLVEGKKIWLTQDKESEDRYGRDLRFVFLIGKNTSDITQSINAKIVEDGYAKSVAYKPNTTYKTVFDDLQAKAQQRQLGMWKRCSST